MKNVLRLWLALGLLVLPSVADAVICPAEADTYIMHGGMCNGYPDRNEVKVIGQVWADALMRFDLSGIPDANGDGEVNGDDIAGATFKFFTHDCEGMMCIPVAPEGTAQTATLYALDVWRDHPYGLTHWTEAPQGDYEHGYISGCTVGEYNYDPGNVPGTEVAMSYDKGPGHWGEVDVTAIVRAWLDGIYPNNGLRVEDTLDDYAWYWSSKDYTGAGQGSGDPTKIHYLDITPVPEPGGLLLLATGLLSVLVFVRRERA